MKRLIIGFLAVIGGLSVVAVLVLALFGLISSLAKPGVGGSTVLQLDLQNGVIEAIPDDPVANLMLEDKLEMTDLLDALARASGDRRVKALVARIGGSGIGLAHIQEIRDAVLRFRKSGKRAIAYAETFGEFGPGNGGYYLASAFDEIYLQPSGDVCLSGLMYETPFVRGTLDKLDIEPQMDHRYEYKNAMNIYTERAYTEAHRRAMQELMDSQFSQIVQGIAAWLERSEEETRALFDRGPFLGPEALDAGLVNGLLYEHELYAKLEEDLGDFDKLYLQDYLDRAGRPNRRGETIALIHAYGAVARGSSRYSPIDGSVVMGSDSVVDALRTAIEDRRVKAIVLRVDSPGGSYVASDTIWNETKRARASGKPLIVSMGNLAGSGGYFVAMEADKIVAEPGTITASIGVLGGKLITSGLWNKLGVSFDEVHTSRNSTMFSSLHPYDEAGYARFQAWLDRVYEDFTGKVAAGRGLSLEQVQEIAKGRIWTGEDALRLGLVDRLGGVHEALALAREALGLDEDAAIRVRRIPAERTPFEMIFGSGPDNRRVDVVGAMARELRELQPDVRTLQRSLGGNSEGVLSMPEVPDSP